MMYSIGPGPRAQVASTTALAALKGIADGAIVATAHPRAALWRRDRTSTLTADGLAVLAAADTGYWVRDLVAGAPGAAAVAAWYVDTGAGDNSAAGTAAETPVRDVEEVLYRIGQQPVGAGGSTTLINITGDTPARAIEINVNLVDNGILAFVGTKTVLDATHTISAHTDWAPATGVIGSYTLSGAPNLTNSGWVGKFCRINAGARTGWKSPIVKDLGSGVFRGNFGQQSDYSAVEPVNADPVSIYSPSKFGGNVTVRAKGLGTVFFQDLDIGVVGADHSTICTEGQVVFLACTVRGLDAYQGTVIVTVALCQVIECRAYGYIQAHASSFSSVGGATLAARRSGVISIATRCLAVGTVIVGHGTEGRGQLIVSAPLGIADYNGDGLIVWPASLVTATDVVFLRDKASVSANGFHILAGGGFYYSTGKLPVAAGTAPTVEVLLASTSKALTDLPLALNGASFQVNQ
jgi:hypothetical protein